MNPFHLTNNLGHGGYDKDKKFKKKRKKVAFAYLA